jgi:hypothetical protein
MCLVDSQIFSWRLHFLDQTIVLAACLQKTGGFARNWPLVHAKFASDWRPIACKFYPSGRHSHANCTRVAARRMQHELNRPKFFMRLAATRASFACDWRPLGYNLHATGGHSVTRQETSRQEVCKRLSLHYNCIFLALASDYSADGPLDIWFGKCVGTMDGKATRKQILHALGAS